MIESWNDLSSILIESGFKLLIACICGFLLGFERERSQKPAGLRTIVLITVGSTLFMIVSTLIPFMTDWPGEVTRADPSRIASQVVSGIGFLGAGAIIQARGSIHGLTTAAVIWVAAGVGLCIGIGFPLFAIFVTILVLLALVVMEPLRGWLSRRGSTNTIELYVKNDQLTMDRARFVLQQNDIRQKDIEVLSRTDEELLIRVNYFVTAPDAASRLLGALAQIDGIRGNVTSSNTTVDSSRLA